MGILDTNHDTMRHLEALRNTLGTGGTIIRYINPLGPMGEKTVKPAEARAISAAGLRLGLVCEGWGGAENFKHGDINAETGMRDGGFCANYAATLGAPPSAAIYFAVDTDCSPGQIRDLVLPYFAAVKKAVAGRFRIGVYGCGAVCDAVLVAWHAELAWLTNAMGWNGSRAFRDSKRWNILQHLPQNIAGIDTDPDEINPAHPNIGDFVPFAAAGSAPPPVQPMPVNPGVTAAVAGLQRALNAAGAVPPLDDDGFVGPLTLAALKKAMGS